MVVCGYIWGCSLYNDISLLLMRLNFYELSELKFFSRINSAEKRNLMKLQIFIPKITFFTIVGTL